MWSCRLSTISKVRLYNFVLYEENTGHMHQIAPLTTSKCKKLSLWEGDTLRPPPPSLAPLPRRLFFTAPLKLNPGYATVNYHHLINRQAPGLFSHSNLWGKWVWWSQSFVYISTSLKHLMILLKCIYFWASIFFLHLMKDTASMQDRAAQILF